MFGATEKEQRELIEAQERCDSVMQSFGREAPRPLDGETPYDYRVRMASQLKKHSDTWKGVELRGLTPAALNTIETLIYADAVTAAENPKDGKLRCRITRDETGRQVKTYYGDSHAAWEPFKLMPREVTFYQNSRFRTVD